MACEELLGSDRSDLDYFIVRDEGGFFALFLFLVFNIGAEKFVRAGQYSDSISLGVEFCGGGGDSGGEELTLSERWVTAVSVWMIKVTKTFSVPMECCGCIMEYILNLLSHNGHFLGLMCRILLWNVEWPERGSDTFISAIGHLDGRIELFKTLKSSKLDDDLEWQVQMGDRALMDLCMMCSKLAYENGMFVRKVVQCHWKMHFVGFYNCWNEYQNRDSTQVFIMCDREEDANLIVVSFRGTEPFCADDWMVDFDYTWYRVPDQPDIRVHTGFLEALGLGTRVDTSTFLMNLQAKVEVEPEMGKWTAYYVVRHKLKELLKQHKNAKFIVTGHSLGGALAIMFPTVLVLRKEEELLQRLLGVYTFGQPRVGNCKLGQRVDEALQHPKTRYWRVVYCNDVVPRLPYDDNVFTYKHFGTCLYYNSLYIEKKVDEEPDKNYFGLLWLIPHYATAWWELMRSVVMWCVYGWDYRESWESFLWRVLGLVMPGCSAHSPLNYVNSIRLGRTAYT